MAGNETAQTTPTPLGSPSNGDKKCQKTYFERDEKSHMYDLENKYFIGNQPHRQRLYVTHTRDQLALMPKT